MEHLSRALSESESGVFHLCTGRGRGLVEKMDEKSFFYVYHFASTHQYNGLKLKLTRHPESVTLTFNGN